MNDNENLVECEECGEMTDDPRYVVTLQARLFGPPEDCYPEEGITICPACESAGEADYDYDLHCQEEAGYAAQELRRERNRD